jgi:hypothetical protein
MELKTEGVQVFGPADDGTIPGMDVGLADQDTFSFSGTNAVVMGEFLRVIFIIVRPVKMSLTTEYYACCT